MSETRRARRTCECGMLINSCSSCLVTNLLVLTEASFLLQFSAEAQRDMLLWARQALVIDQDTPADLPRIVALLEKDQDLPADFADASLAAMAERLDLRKVASF